MALDRCSDNNRTALRDEWFIYLPGIFQRHQIVLHYWKIPQDIKWVRNKCVISKSPLWQCDTVGTSQGEVNLSDASVQLTKKSGAENKMSKQPFSWRIEGSFRGDLDVLGLSTAGIPLRQKVGAQSAIQHSCFDCHLFLYSHQRIHDAPSSSQLVHWFQNPPNCTFNLGGSFFHLPAPKVFYCMHSCDCSSIWHSPTWVFSLRLQGNKSCPHNCVFTEHQGPDLQEGILVRLHHDFHCPKEQSRYSNVIWSSSLEGQRLWCHPTSFVETLINALPSFCSSSSYCAGTDCFRKPWQNGAGKEALPNPVYLTVSITTWHSYL